MSSANQLDFDQNQQESQLLKLLEQGEQQLSKNDHASALKTAKQVHSTASEIFEDAGDAFYGLLWRLFARAYLGLAKQASDNKGGDLFNFYCDSAVLSFDKAAKIFEGTKDAAMWKGVDVANEAQTEKNNIETMRK